MMQPLQSYLDAVLVELDLFLVLPSKRPTDQPDPELGASFNSLCIGLEFFRS
jgi:hypothetical protein